MCSVGSWCHAAEWPVQLGAFAVDIYPEYTRVIQSIPQITQVYSDRSPNKVARGIRDVAERTWLVLGHFRDFPKDLEEAASLDGASRMRTLWSVLLPVSAPSIATAASLAFTMAWGELFLALTFVKGQEVMTAPVALQHLSTGDVQQYGQIMAGAVVSSIPVMVLYYIAQRWVVEGTSAGAFKG